jgi:hypothetical protein
MKNMKKRSKSARQGEQGVVLAVVIFAIAARCRW